MGTGGAAQLAVPPPDPHLGHPFLSGTVTPSILCLHPVDVATSWRVFSGEGLLSFPHPVLLPSFSRFWGDLRTVLALTAPELSPSHRGWHHSEMLRTHLTVNITKVDAPC